MSPLRSSLVGPILLVVLIGATLGFVVQRQLVPPPVDDHVRVSVIALPSTPEPSPKATATPKTSVHIGGRSGQSDGSGGVSNCPAGCQCESRPPSGIVIVCR